MAEVRMRDFFSLDGVKARIVGDGLVASLLARLLADQGAHVVRRDCAEDAAGATRAEMIFEIGRPASENAAGHPLVRVTLPALPDDRAGPATEGEIGTTIGLFTDIDLARGFLGLGPVFLALPYASAYPAVQVALAATLALAAARRDGRPRRIAVPLAAAGMLAMGRRR